MFPEVVQLWLAALPLMGSPGPAVLSVAAMGAAFGPVSALRYSAGVVAGTFSVLLIVASGVTAALLAIPGLAPVVTVLAAGYILYLAYRIATAPVLDSDRKATGRPSFMSGYALAIANPKAFAALSALYAGHSILPDDPTGDAAAKILALTAMIFAANGVWLIFGAAISRTLRDPKAGRIANVVFAVLLIAAVAASVFGL